MRERSVATASVDVSLDPRTAFAVFTEEIGRWWRPGPQNWNNRFRAVGIRIEPGVGGRWLELHDHPEAIFDCGRITVWEPPLRFVFLYRDVGHDIDDTEVEVRFEAQRGKTRVSVEHRRWESVESSIAEQKRRLKISGWGHIELVRRVAASPAGPDLVGVDAGRPRAPSGTPGRERGRNSVERSAVHWLGAAHLGRSGHEEITMLTAPTVDKLYTLNLNGMARAFNEQMERADYQPSPSRSDWACSSTVRSRTVTTAASSAISRRPDCAATPASKTSTSGARAVSTVQPS